MKKQLLLLSTNLAFFSVCMLAQPPKPPAPPKQPGQDERLKMLSEKMEKELKLNAAQKEKMTVAFKDFFAEMEKERVKEAKAGVPPPPPPPPPPPLKKEVMDKLAATRDAKIKSALSADQYKQYLELERSMRPPRPQDPPPAPKKNE